jgi:hypothetical protein
MAFGTGAVPAAKEGKTESKLNASNDEENSFMVITLCG